jgi:hypothetical protein
MEATTRKSVNVEHVEFRAQDRVQALEGIETAKVRALQDCIYQCCAGRRPDRMAGLIVDDSEQTTGVGRLYFCSAANPRYAMFWYLSYCQEFLYRKNLVASLHLVDDIHSTQAFGFRSFVLALFPQGTLGRGCTIFPCPDPVQEEYSFRHSGKI